MHRYKLILQYDGTAYHGWQMQDGLPTIAGTLAHSFEKIFQMPVILLATSRTDAGVHALGQVVSADTELELEPTTMQRVWNHALPPDISIVSISRVNRSFNLFDVEQKTYWYHFFLERPSPFLARYGWYYAKEISVEKLRETFSVFIGTRDFRSFSTGDDREDTVRTIHSIELEYIEQFAMYRVIVKGPKFLHHMIRRIVGACLDVASRKKLSVHFLQQVLEQRKSSSQLTNAPAQGLVLFEVIFNKN